MMTHLKKNEIIYSKHLKHRQHVNILVTSALMTFTATSFQVKEKMVGSRNTK
jgi:hypothetical protein